MLLRRDFTLIALICLVVIILVAVGEAAPPLLSALRVLLGLSYVLFIPGYALQAAVFPRYVDLDKTERLALSFGLSLALIPVVALLLDKLPWGIRTWPILIGEGSLTLLFSLAAILRRRMLPKTDYQPTRYSTGTRVWWASLHRRERLLYGLLAFTILTASVSSAAILFLPAPADFYTEFYMLGPEGLAEKYPREVNVAEDLSVTIGIANHEQVAKTYRVKVLVADSQRPGEQQQVSEAGPFTLQKGENLESSISWQMPSTGQDQRADILLLMDGSPAPYRGLRLFLNVNDR